jgi:xanthine dehydrogenase YagT iron-sulfur-binding subunit
MADKPQPTSEFSRRAFLKGSSAAAAATAMAGSAAEVAAQPAGGAEVIRGATDITLDVNGQSVKVNVEPRTTLLEVLRYQLNLTGAKPVSGEGCSGASTVLVDGKPMMASTLLALAVRGKRIETVESLGGDQPDPVVQAFVAHDAQQCGFCTPGFVVAVRAFLTAHPQATEEQIRAGLNGNLCRCGTYVNVLQAAISLARGGGHG